jgi:DNA-binding MarR family transcriptional regulator
MTSLVTQQFFKPSRELRILSILANLAQDEGQSQQALGKRTCMSGAMVNKYLKDLHAEGHITPVPVNGKCYSYELTASGESARRSLMGEYCGEIVRIYTGLKQMVMDKLGPLSGQGISKLALFGASETCEVVLSALFDSEYRIMAVCDNSPAKQGLLFHGHVVSPPQVLETVGVEAVVITSFGRQQEIFDQLTPMAERCSFRIIRL